jgi:hypothetical protein
MMIIEDRTHRLVVAVVMIVLTGNLTALAMTVTGIGTVQDVIGTRAAPVVTGIVTRMSEIIIVVSVMERDGRERDYYRSRRLEERCDDRMYHDSSRHRRSSSHHRSRSRSWSQSPSRGRNEQRSSPFGDANKEKSAAISSNLAKLKDLYGDVVEKKDAADAEKLRRDSCAEEVIRLGGPRWR